MSAQLDPAGNVVFRATDTSPLHILQALALAFCLAGLAMAWHLWGSPHHPLVSRQAHLAWAGLLALAALAAPAAARAYSRGLAVELRLGDDRTLAVKDAGLWAAGWRTVSLDDIAGADITPGDAAGELTASPTRVKVRVRGGRDFTVPLGQAKEGADRVLAALRGEMAVPLTPSAVVGP